MAYPLGWRGRSGENGPMTRVWRWVLSVGVVLALGGCGGTAALPVPTSVAVARVEFAAIEAKLKRNTTNQLQVHTLLGAPHAVGASVDTNGVRYEEWSYYLDPNGASGGARRNGPSTLEIKFDRQGIVRAYRWMEPKAQ